MILVFDIGNTHTVFGVFSKSGKLERTFRFSTKKDATSDELFHFIAPTILHAGFSIDKIERMVLGSVVPEVEREWRKMSEKFSNLRNFFIADYLAPWGFEIELPNPAQVGSDRLANVQASLGYGAPLIIIDAGTATTFDVVEEKNKKVFYIGGAILPGVGIGLEALVNKTSRLPQLSLVCNSEKLSVVGNSTESAMKSGMIHGFASMVDGMVERIAHERAWKNKTVIATGGFQHLLKGTSKSVNHFLPNLTLEGFYDVASKT